MALQIQGRPTDFCLKNCPNMELDFNTETIYADGDPYFTRSEVSCRYEKICKMWHDHQTTLPTPDDCIGRGKRAVWQIMSNDSSTKFDEVETSYKTKCSCCGVVYSAGNSLKELPSMCPVCQSIMSLGKEE